MKAEQILGPWSPCKLCDAMDFFRPECLEHLNRLQQLPTFHAKQWEYVQVLETRRQLAPNARVLVGLGCGGEPVIPLLAEGAEEVIATDLYGRSGAWDVARQRPDALYPQLKNLRVHPMDMRHIDLPLRSADFVWSLCAVEHVGGVDEIADTVRQAGRLLTESGVLFISTEFNLLDRPYRTSATLFLERDHVRRIIQDSGLHLVLPIQLRLTNHPLNTPLWTGARKKGQYLPHVTYRHQKRPFAGTFGAVVSFVLSRRDHGAALFEEDPELEKIVKNLGRVGRRESKRFSPPWFWW